MVTVSAQAVLKEVPRIESAMSGSTELYEYVKAGGIVNQRAIQTEAICQPFTGQ